jgi:hypothetical protein
MPYYKDNEQIKSPMLVILIIKINYDSNDDGTNT